MDNFVAIDVETANNYPTSICAIAAVKVTDGCISDRFYELVKPEPEFYLRHFTLNVHGIGFPILKTRGLSTKCGATCACFQATSLLSLITENLTKAASGRHVAATA